MRLNSLASVIEQALAVLAEARLRLRRSRDLKRDERAGLPLDETGWPHDPGQVTIPQ